MDFNINKYLQKNLSEDITQPEYIIKNILQKHIINIASQNIRFQKGIVFLQNLSPQEKLHIKLKKNSIIEEAQTQEIVIRDII